MGLGLGEIIIVLFLFFGVIATIFYFLAKYLTIIGGKGCPYCGERIKKAAKICRYCQRDVANAAIENKPPRGLFQ